MNGIRSKITPTVLATDLLGEDGRVYPAGSMHLRVEWVDFQDDADGVEQEHGVLFTEEIVLPPGAGDPTARGPAYVSRVCVQNGDKRPGTYWTDASGAKHYVLSLDPGRLGVRGQAMTAEAN